MGFALVGRERKRISDCAGRGEEGFRITALVGRAAV